MSTDFRLMIEYKEDEDSKWKGLLDEDRKLWDSEYWGISCIKSAFLSRNGYFNDQCEFSEEVINKYGKHFELSIVRDMNIDLTYAYAKNMQIIGDFIKDLADNIEKVEDYHEYRLVISPDC